ncbi:MAG: alpha-N-arabinofuranosidase [Lachnospiraceae bacterium]|nr:alpha-N-arabinofuranosidase [Lachnospiraceae bacterium]
MATLYINEKNEKGHINPEIYGHFSEHLGRCIYEGLYVGENSDIPNVNGMRKDVVAALKEIKVPVLRWPGGCFADEYHWKDGIGPKENRKKMINTHWGGVVEDNSFGTHEFFELCEQLGCKTYVNGNVGSGTVQEMSEWVEYITFDGVSPMAELRKANGHEKPWKIDYFGVGNENWGCGGNMTPEYYGNLYRRYQTYVRQYRSDAPIRKICCGANAADYFWTEGVLKTCTAAPAPGPEADNPGFMNGLSLHYYVHPGVWENKGSATEFDSKTWYQTLARAVYMEELIRRHGAIMDQYDPEKKIGMMVDEWGCWFDVEPGTNPGFLYQQNTMRDALVAGITLNIFNKHCDRVKMACIAQMVNVLQSVILTEGPKMILTPTYHVFHMYRHHQNAKLVASYIDGNKIVGEEEYQMPMLSESVSVSEDGTVNITVGNLSVTEDVPVEISFAELAPSRIEATILTGAMCAHNTFEEPENVREAAFNDFKEDGRKVSFTAPACSIISFRVQ